MRKRSFRIEGHATSIRLEPEFWNALETIAGRRGVTLPVLIGEVDTARMPENGLASALRVYALKSSPTS